MNAQAARANGKLLLTGEYFVLDGALSLAVPTVFGQNLLLEKNESQPPRLVWQSKETDGSLWFEAVFELPSLQISSMTDEATAQRLQQILLACRQGAPSFLSGSQSWSATTKVDFDRRWGLGTSSTLVSLVSKWSGADPFEILKKTFGGSGYDLACAEADGPILFQLEGPSKNPAIRPCYFFPSFHKSLIFIYLGKKQDSRAGIRRYRERRSRTDLLIEKINALTRDFLIAESLGAFEKALVEHENLVSEALGLPRAQSLFFERYPFGEVKSLGAWGGDFVLATTCSPFSETENWLHQNGFSVVLPFEKMILKNDG